MGVAVLALLGLAAAYMLTRKVMSGLVCPFCEGPIRRAYEKTECTRCGRLFYLWQARRK